MSRTRFYPLGLIILGLCMLSTAPARGDFTGDILVANQLGSTILAYDATTGTYQGVFANLGSSSYVQSLVESANGIVYATSPGLGTVLAYNGATGQQISTFQFSDPSPGPYPAGNYSSGITLDNSGNLYVIAQAKGTINEYDPTTGMLIRTVVSGLPSAVGVTYDAGHLYATDSRGLEEYDLAGNLVASVLGSFNNLRTGPDGNIFVTDGNNSVYEFTPSLEAVGSGPYVSGAYSNAFGLGFAPDGSLFVAAAGEPAVYKYDSNGNQIGTGSFISSNSPLINATDVIYNAPPTVPTPSSLVLTIAGLVGLLGRTKWRRRE